MNCHQPTTIWSALLLWHNHPVITGADNKCCTGVNNIGVSCDIHEEVFFFKKVPTYGSIGETKGEHLSERENVTMAD